MGSRADRAGGGGAGRWGMVDIRDHASKAGDGEGNRDGGGFGGAYWAGVGMQEAA